MCHLTPLKSKDFCKWFGASLWWHNQCPNHNSFLTLKSSLFDLSCTVRSFSPHGLVLHINCLIENRHTHTPNSQSCCYFIYVESMLTKPFETSSNDECWSGFWMILFNVKTSCVINQYSSHSTVNMKNSSHLWHETLNVLTLHEQISLVCDGFSDV